MGKIANTIRERTSATALMAAAALWLSFTQQVACAGDVYAEEAVKAAFVLRFTGYVTWPLPPSPTAPFRIAVLGDRAMTTRLQALVENRSVGGRPIDVRQIASLAEARDVQLLYIGSSRSADLTTLPAALRDRGILTITDDANGLETGSIINFLIIDQRVRFEVSTEAAHRSGLGISSELLSVAVRVRGNHAQTFSSSGKQP